MNALAKVTVADVEVIDKLSAYLYNGKSFDDTLESIEKADRESAKWNYTAYINAKVLAANAIAAVYSLIKIYVGHKQISETVRTQIEMTCSTFMFNVGHYITEIEADVNTANHEAYDFELDTYKYGMRFENLREKLVLILIQHNHPNAFIQEAKQVQNPWPYRKPKDSVLTAGESSLDSINVTSETSSQQQHKPGIHLVKLSENEMTFGYGGYRLSSARTKAISKSQSLVFVARCKALGIKTARGLVFDTPLGSFLTFSFAENEIIIPRHDLGEDFTGKYIDLGVCGFDEVDKLLSTYVK